jgi:glutamine synthetase
MSQSSVASAVDESLFEDGKMFDGSSIAGLESN